MAELPPGIRRAFRLARGRPRIEDDVDDEVAFHLEMRAAELVARGWTPEAARAEAVRRFGDTRQWSVAMSEVDRGRITQERRAEWLDDLRLDVRYGVRSLLRAPVFSLLAIVTLALGIGANAAVFGVVKSVLLDALPYADAERLVRIYTRSLDGSADRLPISPAMITDIAERQRSFARLAAFNAQPVDVIYDGGDEPRVARLAWVEPGLFATLGVPAALGRTFAMDDVGDTARVVVMEHDAWQRLFGGDAGAVGRDIRINGIPRRVIGVLPREFAGPVGDVDFYFALDLRPHLADPVNARRRQWWGLVGRLKPGVAPATGQRELAAIGEDLAREFPQFHARLGVVGTPVREAMVGDTRTPLLALLASAGLVLLITCANLAGALLSRTLSRRKEFAVRVALGAGRGRLMRQLLTESSVLAALGGALGIALAAAGLDALRGIAPASLPAHADVTLDAGAVMVMALVALATGLAFGIAPALTAGRSNVHDTLREETRGGSESRRTRSLRGVLVAAQIALCVSLLAGAGLLARSLWEMTSAPTGLDPEGVLTLRVQLPAGRYPTAEVRAQFMAEYEEKLRAIPGVVAAASTGDLPTGVSNRSGLVVDGPGATAPDAMVMLVYNEVSGAYFRTLGIPLLAGRTFGVQDATDAPMAVIVSESGARRLVPDGSAVGTRVRLSPEESAPRATIVGVVGDVRNDPAQTEPAPAMYLSNSQIAWNGPVFLLRTRGDPLALVRPAREALGSIDPSLPLHDPATLRERLADGLAGRRLPVVLMSAFGILALLLASVGVYAMFAAMTAAREREFGVRVALGSTPREIGVLVVRQGGGWMLAGLAGGAAGVFMVARLIRGLLYGVTPFDPIALGLAVTVLLACAAIALLVPVRRATRVDPIRALR